MTSSMVPVVLVASVPVLHEDEGFLLRGLHVFCA